MKKIGVGYENYKDFIDNDMYYVDKTLLIRDIIEKGGKVTLFTRPRRFGKTLALSMIQTFFEEERDTDGKPIDKSKYFDGMKVMSCEKSITSKLGQYPVINLSLKSGKQDDFYNSFMILRKIIIGEFTRHIYLAESDKLTESEKQAFISLEHGEIDWEKLEKTFKDEKDRRDAFRRECGKYAVALKTLSELLEKHHGKKTIILIDEYDVPLENAYRRNFFDDMVGLIRSLFESALKTNNSLEFAVVTGCLRISKESIFTGLNNLKVNSIRDVDFGEYFGFLQQETDEMLESYNLSDNTDIVKEWYDGYLFGNTSVYNPWSVIKFIDDHISDVSRLPEAYWSNTSSNSIIKDLIEKSDDSVKDELDVLISGGCIEKRIHEDITYDDIDTNNDNLWNFLYFTGYMKAESTRLEDDLTFLTMRIPNREIRSLFKTQIKDWFDEKVKSVDFKVLHDAIRNTDTNSIEEFVSDLLLKSISYFDNEESFYHGLFLSLLYGMPNYRPKSNRETGEGRPDIVLYPDRPKDPAYIFELKTRKRFDEMDDGIKEAFKQIHDMKYEQGILDEGYSDVISFGICFCKKSCIVKLYKH